MLVVVAGISHKTASLELRERLTLDEEASLRVAQELLDEGVACEAVALSTCNRTELYLYGRDSLAARLAALDRLIYHATLLGLPFLTMGMAAGVIRAETFRVPGWPTDPMVLLSAAAWAVYLVLIAGRVRRDWSGTAVAWLSVAGLVLLLVIRFAAVPYLSGFHTYGG